MHIVFAKNHMWSSMSNSSTITYHGMHTCVGTCQPKDGARPLKRSANYSRRNLAIARKVIGNGGPLTHIVNTYGREFL
jgi:hypothetical protein